LEAGRTVTVLFLLSVFSKEGLPFVGVRRRWRFPSAGVRRREKRESGNPDPPSPPHKNTSYPGSAGLFL